MSKRSDELAEQLKADARSLTPERAIKWGQAGLILRSGAKHALIHAGYQNPSDMMAADLMLGHALSLYELAGVSIADVHALVDAQYAASPTQIVEAERAVHEAIHSGTKPT